MSRERTLSLLLALALATVTAPAAGEMSVGREVLVSGQAADEHLPRVAYNSSRDEFLVVWNDRWDFVVYPEPFQAASTGTARRSVAPFR
jgi:hypothetical protein